MTSPGHMGWSYSDQAFLCGDRSEIRWQMGGALAEPTPGAGARAILPGRLCVFALGVPEDEASAALIGSTLAAMDRALEPVTVGAYSNFIEERAQTSFSFDEDTWARLRRAKAL